MAAIGIDLGTSCTRAAVWQRGKVEVITNENYERSLASCVTIKRTHNKRLVGNTALLQTDLDPTNTYTIQGVKSLIGRKFNDPMIQEDIKHSLLYVADYSGKPNIEIKLKNETTQFAPEEISSMILMEMKEAAEAYLGSAVHDAVITVPAHFGVSQRQATKNAGAIAGLNVIGIINDPTAAALAYSFGKDFKGKRNVLIFDLGGGTFDVSIITIDEGTLFEVKAIASDTHLGGKDFDNRLVDYIKNDYRCKHNMNLQCTPITHYQLYRAAEKAKCDLSSSMKTTVSLLDNHDYQTQITREKFEEINADLFHRTIETVKRVLKDAELDKNEIDDVVLVGGLTNIPKVQSLLENYFCGKKVIRSVHSEELVVCGAAIQAAILSGATSPRLRLVRLMEVTPHSIGIETHHGVMAKIIERNSKIPCERTLTFTTYSDNQSDISFQLYEGEQAFTKYNSVLGTFNLLNIKKASRGMPLYDVRFHIDINGILEVTAEESGTGFNKTIVNNKDRPSQIEIDRMIAEAKRYHDKKIKRQKQSIERRMSLEYMNKVQNLLLLNCSRLSEEIQKKGFSIYSEMLMLLANGSKCKNRLQKMKQLFTSIMTILNKNIPNEMKILGGYPLIITENVDN